MVDKKNKTKNKDSKLGNKYEELEARYKRALADYQNLLKRTADEKVEFVKYANEQFLYEIIPVYDNLKMAIKHNNGEDSWFEGIKFVIKQFQDKLKDLGVEEILTKDVVFNHNTMEAVENEKTKDKKKDGVVKEEVRAGYKLKGKVIIPAKVIVFIFKK